MSLTFYTPRQDARLARLRDAHKAVVAAQAAISALGDDAPAECEDAECVLDGLEGALFAAADRFNDTLRDEAEARRMDFAA
ncbi:hypothetical protein [Acetobacter aceti]|uniref:hypothetical protein n=1 Tax=Acetobacter aceti TaxID=435 RepID=UPI000C08D3C9|nr:hypothetical protein [Acetobacter aceti]